MPLYQFQCEACGHALEFVESIKTFKPRKKCPQCKKNKLRQIYGVPFAIVGGSDRETLGTYAEKNTKRVGKTKIEERDGRRAEQAEKDRLNTPLPPGMSHAKRDDSKAWWRKGKKQNRKLGTLTSKQQADYVFKGKLPDGKS